MLQVVSFTLPAGQSVSDAVDCSAYSRVARLIMPDDWTGGAPLTFQLSTDGTSYHNLYHVIPDAMQSLRGHGAASEAGLCADVSSRNGVGRSLAAGALRDGLIDCAAGGRSRFHADPGGHVIRCYRHRGAEPWPTSKTTRTTTTISRRSRLPKPTSRSHSRSLTSSRHKSRMTGSVGSHPPMCRCSLLRPSRRPDRQRLHRRTTGNATRRRQCHCSNTRPAAGSRCQKRPARADDLCIAAYRLGALYAAGPAGGAAFSRRRASPAGCEQARTPPERPGAP
jgi:hypothetical protein